MTEPAKQFRERGGGTNRQYIERRRSLKKGLKRARISQCMIVKNEEKNIERALTWGKEIVSEQIVVDTGSTDRTVEIATRMGAKVYHFDWIDDFAAAKNFAISKASGDWIALLDADEYFTAEDGRKIFDLVQMLHGQDCDGIMTAWYNMSDNGTVMSIDSQIRIFRNRPELRYRRRIHEQLVIEGRKLKIWDAVKELGFYHTGYGEAELSKKVGNRRNFNLIQAELEENPNDYEMLAYLGNEYEALGEWDNAQETYRRAADNMPAEMRGHYDVTTSEVYFRLLELLLARSGTKEEDILACYQEAVKGWPEEADYDYLMGDHYAELGNYQAGEMYLRQALTKLEQFGNAAKAKVISAKIMKAYELLAICCFNNGNLADCVKLTTMLLKEDRYLMSTLVVLISAFRKDMEQNRRGSEGAAEVAAFLGRSFYDFSLLKDKLFVMKASGAARYPALETVVKGLFSPEELSCLEQTGTISRTAAPAEGDRKQRILLFYSEIESFNFFNDQLADEFGKRGQDVFIFDLRSPLEEGPHSFQSLNQFLLKGLDTVICFDGLGTREDMFIDLWNQHKAMVLDVLMDPPFRFHPTLEKHPKNYRLFCCDHEHVAYVKKYFPEMAPFVAFMPHVGVVPPEGSRIIPYQERKYDILFSGTYYRPQDKLMETRQLFPGNDHIYQFYEAMYQNLITNPELPVEQAALHTLDQIGGSLSEESLKTILNRSVHLDWAIRMYEREQVVTTLAEAGLELYLLGRGWENHPACGRPNVHRIDDRIPYGDTLAYMADARINLNVMPWFKEGTHDRIFNTLLQHSVPLTDPSTWIKANFTDGEDIALYDLKHLENLPGIARRLLKDQDYAESIIQKGFEKVKEHFTWSHCAQWLLAAARGEKVEIL